MKTSFLVFRHQVVENPNNIFYGVSQDLPISLEGQEKARATGVKLREAGVTPLVFYASNLTRAQMTAREIRDGIGNNIEVVTDTGLVDVSYPDFEGRAVSEGGKIDLGNGKIASLDQMDEYSAETPLEAGTRFSVALKAIGLRHPGELVGIVSHGDPIAWGLELMRSGEKADFAMKGLIERGVYPAKGDLALARLNPDGTFDGDVIFRPVIDQIPSLLESRSGRKES